MAKTRSAFRTGLALARTEAADLLNLLYPPACVLCRCDAPPGRELCDSCEVDLVAQTAVPSCPACGGPIDHMAGGVVACPWCDGSGIGRVKRVARLGVYDGPLRQLIHLAKYRGRWELADSLGDRLCAATGVEKLLAEVDVLLPVPLHPIRQVHRGYNQSDRLARRLGKRFGLPVVQPIARRKPTAAQASLTSVAARRANVRDAFELLDPLMIHGKRVAIVDDVTTSGATLRSLAYTLHPAKPASMAAVLVAVADVRNRRFEVV